MEDQVRDAYFEVADDMPEYSQGLLSVTIDHVASRHRLTNLVLHFDVVLGQGFEANLNIVDFLRTSEEEDLSVGQCFFHKKNISLSRARPKKNLLIDEKVATIQKKEKRRRRRRRRKKKNCRCLFKAAVVVITAIGGKGLYMC